MDGSRRSKLTSVWVLNSEIPNIESLSAVCCELGHHLLLLNPFSSVGSEDSSVCVAGVLIGGVMAITEAHIDGAPAAWWVVSKANSVDWLV